jgi:hypothetical protein
MYLAAEIEGEPIPHLTDALFDLDFDRGVSQCQITAREEPANWDYDRRLTLGMGNGENDLLRFDGLLWEPSWGGPKGKFSATGRGRLSRLETFRQTNPKGQLPEALTGTLHPTLGQLVMGILDVVGIEYAPENIDDDPTILLGTIDPSPLRWQHNHTARQYLSELEKVAVGRRLFETLASDVFFYPVVGRPRGSSDFTFTAGVDIFADWSTVRTVRRAHNYVSVIGFARSHEDADRITYQDWTPNAFQPEGTPYPIELHSDWIQTTAHAQAMWDFLGQEHSREWVEATFVTYRDDALGPGQTISVLLPDGHVTEPMWLRGVSGYCRGKWRQHLRLQGGGEAPEDYIPSWLPYLPGPYA